MINAKSVELIKAFEGFRAEPYQCSAGIWTIGYGSTYTPDDKKVTESTPAISEEEAHEWFVHGLRYFSAEVDRLVTVLLTEDRHGALVSLVYNIGAKAFAGSNLLRCLNRSDFEQACIEWAEWRKANGKISNGLVRRRTKEIKQFKEG